MSQRVGAKRRPMINSAKCETGWGDSPSTRALLKARDRHPTPPLISFASTLPLQGRVSKGANCVCRPPWKIVRVEERDRVHRH
jgi:hypothetical protein